MVQVNEHKRQIKISTQGGTEDLYNMQMALIELLSSISTDFGFDRFSLQCLMDLLRMLIPDIDQQKRGFASETDYVELPNDMPTDQKELIKEAIYWHNTGSKSKHTNAVNPIIEALKKTA